MKAFFISTSSRDRSSSGISLPVGAQSRPAPAAASQSPDQLLVLVPASQELLQRCPSPALVLLKRATLYLQEALALQAVCCVLLQPDGQGCP